MPAKTCSCKSVYTSRKIWNIFGGICRIPLPAWSRDDWFRIILAVLIIGTHFCLMHGSVIQVYNWRIVDCYSDGYERCCGKVGCSGQSRLELQTRSDGAHSPGGNEENRDHGADTGPAVLLSPSHGWQSVQWSQRSPGSCPDALQTVPLWRHQEEMHVFAPEGSGRYFNNYWVNSKDVDCMFNNFCMWSMCL